MFKHPYETTACANHVIQPVIAGLKQAQATGELIPVRTASGNELQGIYTIPSYVKGIAPFSHPMVVDFAGRQSIVIDARAYLRFTSPNEPPHIAVPVEYNFLVMRALLVRHWLQEGGSGDLLSISDLPARVLCDWLPKAIVRLYGLDPYAQQAITALTGYFFFSQFDDAVEYDESRKIKIAERVRNLTAVPVQVTLELIDDLPPVRNMFDYVNALKTKIPTARLEHFNAGVLITRISGAWFGAAANEVVAVAIEYPPYLMAMIYTAANDRGYRKTRIGETVEHYDRNNAARNFVQSIAHLISLS